MNAKKLLVLFTLAFCFLSVVPLAFAQNQAGGPGASSDKNDSNPGTASDIREDFYKRMKNAKSFAPVKFGGEDVVKDEESIGPGYVEHHESGPVQVWPVPVKEAISKVPTLRDQGIQKNLLKTFGLPVSDTQYQVIHRYNQNIMLEQLFDPEKVIWVINAMGMVQAQSAANSEANLARNQASSAIEYAEKYLPNFTTQAGNRWNTIRDKLFVPMAVLLLLPGAVLAQVKAIIAQGSPLFGDVNPFDGIIRSIMAIFFIPATYLVVNYGIDVSNSMALTIRENYQRIFHSNMYKDAECAEKRAFPIRPKDSNDNGIFRKAKPTGKGAGDLQAWTDHERNSYDIYGSDPCKGSGNVNDLADETTPVLMNMSRVAVNGANVLANGTWNVMCAFQLAYLHYLFLMGPIVAALWVWPIDTFRKALGSWIEGVLIICFWALFWNTTILLMACFRNVCVTGTVIMTALNCLAIYSVQHAFNFLGLVQAAGREAASAAQEAGSHAAGQAAAVGAKHGAGAQGSTISNAAAEGHARSAGERASGVPNMGTTPVVTGGQGGVVPAGGVLGGIGGSGTSGGPGGSGGTSGHGGVGSTSPFHSTQGSSSAAGQQGPGDHVAPPPGTTQGANSQFSGGGPGTPGVGHGAGNAPPSFGSPQTGAGGSHGQGGAAGSAGHGGASTPGSTGGQGAQQPPMQGSTPGSLSSSQSSHSSNALSHGQAAGTNVGQGQGLPTGDVHAQQAGANLSANMANQLHSAPPPAGNLNQANTANLGLHENTHIASTNVSGGGGIVDAQGSNIVHGGTVQGTPSADMPATSASGFPSDIAYSMPPSFEQPTFVSPDMTSAPPVEVQTTQTEYVTTQSEVQNTQTEFVNTQSEVQNMQTELNTQYQDTVVGQVYESPPPFVPEQPPTQVFEQPQYIAGGLEQSHVVEHQTTTNTENVSNQTIVDNSTQSGGLIQPGFGGPTGSQGIPQQGLPNAPLPGSSALARAMGPGMAPAAPASNQPTRHAEFNAPTSFGGHREKTEELASLPPSAQEGAAPQRDLKASDAEAANQGHESLSKGSKPVDGQPQKPRLAAEDADENESYT